MADRRDKRVVQHVFETSLSGLREDPYLAQRVIIIAHGKDDRIMNIKDRRDSSRFIVVALILVLVFATSAKSAISVIYLRKSSFVPFSKL